MHWIWTMTLQPWYIGSYLNLEAKLNSFKSNTMIWLSRGPFCFPVISTSLCLANEGVKVSKENPDLKCLLCNKPVFWGGFESGQYLINFFPMLPKILWSCSAFVKNRYIASSNQKERAKEKKEIIKFHGASFFFQITSHSQFSKFFPCNLHGLRSGVSLTFR